MTGMQRKKRPSMQDVADLAGVSRTTVSFVLNEVTSANISAATRERVLEAVEALDYRPNVLARGLRAQHTQTIGLISDEVATTPFAGRMILGAQEQAWTEDYLILLVSTGGDYELKEAAANTMIDRRVDGIIFATMWHRECHPPAAMWQVPSVLLDCFVADHSLPSVVPDEVRGGYEATSLLLQQGHRRVGFITNEDPVPATVGRLQGYQQALAEYGLPLDPDLVVTGFSDQASGYNNAIKLFHQADRPTALFCYNDRIAMGAYDALRKLGLAVPDDVAVVGFDDLEIISAHLYPPLTTMRLPHYEMGRWAVRQLLGQINRAADDAPAPLQEKLVCPLVRRKSA